MNFAIPREDNSEMLFYIWKIIDLPFLSLNELLYKISFELFLLPPVEAKIFVEKCITNNLLEKTNNQKIRLSNNLNQKFEEWQIKRKNGILENINSAEKVTKLKNEMDQKDSAKFSVLINVFADKGTLNRSVTISNSSFEILEYDYSKGIINSKVAGSKEESYVIEINTNEKILKHNCHDFESRRAENKKFCKHIVKLFLILKEKNEKIADSFLNKIAEEIDDWDFSS